MAAIPEHWWTGHVNSGVAPWRLLKRSELHTFRVLPRRWVVERTFGWLERYRRLDRDYSRQAQTGETMVYLAMIRLMMARLAKS
jgi:transposase